MDGRRSPRAEARMNQPEAYGTMNGSKPDGSSLPYELYPLGEQAVVIRWEGGIGESMRRIVTDAMRCLMQENHFNPHVIELVRAYRTITVYYDPVQLYLSQREPASPYELMTRWIRSRLEPSGSGCLSASLPEEESSVITVPVCFSGQYGPDLNVIAQHAGLSIHEAVQLYCSAVYVVHMIGFLPGFPYMSGLPERLAAPRLSKPRLEVPAGSVGIAGTQTGIYPMASPGGWQLIGRTPIRLFDPGRERPSLLQAGDRVRFEPIDPTEFTELWADNGC